MSKKRTTARAFHDAAGVEDWRVLFSGAHAHSGSHPSRKPRRSLPQSRRLPRLWVTLPTLTVRPEGVTVRTVSGEYGAMSNLDVELARRISAEARRLGLEPDPSQVQVVNIAVAQDAGSDVGPFWAAALGYRNLGPKEDVVHRHRRNPQVSFQGLRPPKPGRGRTHIDVSVPADQAEARVAVALEAGGRVVDGSHVPNWWTLASPDNHKVDIAAWPDFEDDAED
jgi:4a-hydroxytetrahydrobiopterin dehydratase